MDFYPRGSLNKQNLVESKNYLKVFEILPKLGKTFIKAMYAHAVAELANSAIC